MTNIAERDQFAAACAEWADQTRIKYEALTSTGFPPDIAGQLLCTSLIADVMGRQNVMLQALTDNLPKIDPDE